MPIYELYCQDCGHEYEQIVPFSATTLPACPTCRSEEVGRRMSRPAIHFKGSGWYITDSRKGSNGNGKHTNGAGSDSSSDKPESKAASENAAGENGTGEKAPSKSESSASNVSKAEGHGKPAGKSVIQSSTD